MQAQIDESVQTELTVSSCMCCPTMNGSQIEQQIVDKSF